MVVPSLPPGPGGQRPDLGLLSKEPLRRTALDARKAFVNTLSDADRALLEQRLAERLNMAASTITQWPRVPAERVLAVEAVTGISRYDLRPDVYGPAPKRRKIADAPACGRIP